MIRYQLVCGSAGGDAAPPIAKTSGTAKPGAKLGAKSDAVKSASKTPRKASGCGESFESWFQGSDAFDALVKKRQVTCPACGSADVEKALMAPSVKTTKGKERKTAALRRAAEHEASSDQPRAPAHAVPAAEPDTRVLASLTSEQRAVVDAMRKVRAHVLANSENVGKQFAEEARKIHHEEADARSIHGEASIEEAKALAEEGIDILPLPILPDDRN